MTITFPCDMPAGGVEEQYFEIQRVDALSPENRGRSGAVQLGFPLWLTTITLSNLAADEADDWNAFLDSLNGAANAFYGSDLSRPFPKLHPTGFSGLVRAGGSDAFDGAASTWSLNSARDVISMTGLPAGFVLSKRDYVGFKWGTNRRALVRTVEAATADASGNLSVTVRPSVPGSDSVTVVPADAVCHFDNPKCLMRLVTQKTTLTGRDVLHSLGGTVTAVQDLLP